MPTLKTKESLRLEQTSETVTQCKAPDRADRHSVSSRQPGQQQQMPDERGPYVLRLCRGTTKWWRLAERYLDFSYLGLFVPSLDDSYRDARLAKINVSYQNVPVFSVSINPTPWFFLTFSPNGWDFLVQILLSDYTFLSTLDYKFLFNYLQLWQSCAILSATIYY